MIKRILLLFLFVQLGQILGAQIRVDGKVFDSETGSPLPFVSIKIEEIQKGTRTDENGEFILNLPNQPLSIEFSCVGFETQNYTWSPPEDQIELKMDPKVQQIREVTVRPKKYRNKNNPTVALIKQVIQHRDENRIEKRDFFYEEQYEKVLVGFSNLPDKLKDRKVLKDWKFAFENTDSSKLQDKNILPFYIQENLIDFYSKNDPSRSKKYIKGTQTVEFPGYIDQEGINRALQYVNQDVNLYDNYVVLLTDHFMSPIANLGPTFYRYYPLDTLEQNGSKIIRLAFYPRNKNDMLLQGELHIAPDNNYAVTKAIFGVNPRINLNWVNTLELDQDFVQLPSGKWVIAREYYKLEFGLKEKGTGIYGERLVTHQGQQINEPIPDSLFKGPDPVVYLDDSDRKEDTTYWESARHEKLSNTESQTYANMDSLQKTKLFKTTAQALLILFVGYVPAGKVVEVGPLNTFVAFNPVEGYRLRFGGRTRTVFSDKFRLEGYGAYGFRDERWKYGGTATLALGKSKHNRFPYNRVKANFYRDIRIPGLSLFQVSANSILTSFVRGINDRFLYTDYYNLEYEKEFQNHFSFKTGLEHHSMGPAGALSFEPTEAGGQASQTVDATRAYLEMRYSPKESIMETGSYRQIIDYNYIATLRYSKGFKGLEGNYDFHQVEFFLKKWSNTPPFGFNVMYLEAGGVFGKVPYPLLTIHRANQTYLYQRGSFNMMNFMEFISDRYVSVTFDHDFYGFFLNKIPILNKLKLREAASLKVLYGSLSSQNQPTPGSELYYLPRYDDGTPISYTLESKPYIEASIGLGNIFRVFRIDLVRRFTYLDHPGAPKYGIRGRINLYF